MKRKLLVWLFWMGAALVALPFWAVHWLSAQTGMLVSIGLLFSIDPLCAVATGLFAGTQPRQLWPLPFGMTGLFVWGGWAALGMDGASLLLYGGIYLLLGLTVMAIAAARAGQKPHADH